MKWTTDSVRLLLAMAVLLPVLCSAARAAEPADAVRSHFLEISAENYSGADQYFSAAFRRAFKGDFAAMDRYYIMRRAQLRSGYEIIASQPLADPNRETARVTVEFKDPSTDRVVLVAERMHYYLVREKADERSPLRDSSGMAWRIDIFDALEYESLAEARRRPYLYTREAWAEDEGRELKAQQGLYRVQQALESFKRVTGQYPLRLLGADNRRDELISGKYLPEKYPLCGFDDRPMQAVEFGIRSSGDFSYYSIDKDGDGKPDGYWLLLHGKIPGNALFAGRDTIMLLADGYRADQGLLAYEFAQWWAAQRGEIVKPGPVLGGNWGSIVPDPMPLEPQPEPNSPELVALDNPPLTLDVVHTAEELLAPGVPAPAVLPEHLPAGRGDSLNSEVPSSVVGSPYPTDSDEAANTGDPSHTPLTPSALISLPVPVGELIVHSWGFR
jgi:hypothetical protein